MDKVFCFILISLSLMMCLLFTGCSEKDVVNESSEVVAIEQDKKEESVEVSETVEEKKSEEAPELLEMSEQDKKNINQAIETAFAVDNAYQDSEITYWVEKTDKGNFLILNMTKPLEKVSGYTGSKDDLKKLLDESFFGPDLICGALSVNDISVPYNGIILNYMDEKQEVYHTKTYNKE